MLTYIAVCVSLRGLPAPEAEMLYMQEVEKMEGYGQESTPAKVNTATPTHSTCSTKALLHYYIAIQFY
jgi:hypothetical protein